MRLLQYSNTGEYHLTEPFTTNEAIPSYAILSHTWGVDIDEVTFDDLKDGTGTSKPGYEKIRFCAEQAKQDGLEYIWIDTCYINKENKAELSKAINSMFRWYYNANRCYIYLSDVSTAKWKVNGSGSEWEAAFRRSRWFTRGWTLQELLAPRIVEFFSRQRKHLGDTRSLREHIHEITGIPEAALQGELLSQFSVNDRLSWIEHRETKREEDKAYSLLDIFGVYMPPIYGERIGRAFDRLREEIKKLEECVRDLHVTDPRRDKARIEETKGGLLKESCYWIFQNIDFLCWRNNPQSRLLWIRGDPGKGKTVILCSIINELGKSMGKTTLISYFFCQATDSRIISAVAVLRGLLFMLVSQQPSLISHLREKHDQTGKALFGDINAWVILSDIFTDIVQDANLKSIYLVVDALDECIADLPKLLDFIIQTSSTSPHVKWIISARNWPDIGERLDRAGDKVRLRIELNAKSVSAAVCSYISYRVSRLAHDKKYSGETKRAVLDYLKTNANDTFLWAALVCQSMEKMSRFNIVKKLEAFPPGLDSLYNGMILRINNLDDADLCKHVLAIVAIVYRPITLQELSSLVEELNSIAGDLDSVREIVGLCGSLLTLQDGIIYFVHKSARDFLLTEAFDVIFPSGSEVVHYAVFSKSLRTMSDTLRRNVYELDAIGCPIEQIKQPEPDPLAASRYSCIYWVDHLSDWSSDFSIYDASILESGGMVDNFMRKEFLYWLEALSLCQSISKGVVSMARLEALAEERASASSTMEVVQDARRFIMSHKSAIESHPLQTYGALLFSPTRSVIRTLFHKEELKGILIKPEMERDWTSCLLTLEGHSSYVNCVAFSHDSTRLASASHDMTVSVWDASIGERLLTLEGHRRFVSSVAFSHNSARLASASWDNTIKVWDAYSGECLLTLKGHSSCVNSVSFSHDSTWLASGSWDNTVKIWDAHNGECLLTLEGHSSCVSSVAFSHNSTRLASASFDGTVRVWDTHSGECFQKLRAHDDVVDDQSDSVEDDSDLVENPSNFIESVVFSHDSSRLTSASWDNTVKVWDAYSGKCLSRLEGHNNWVYLAAFSHDLTRLASVSWDSTIKLWDAGSGACLSTIEVDKSLHSISFDPSDKNLRTDLGVINISVLPKSITTSTSPKPQITRHESVDVRANGSWITYNSENLLLLPPNYRPSRSAVSGGVIAMGVGKGRVWICEVQKKHLLGNK